MSWKLPVVLMLSLTGCGGAPATSQPKVLSGVGTVARPEVVRIDNRNLGEWCTGTFVNDTTMLTASHCISVDAVGGGISLYDHPSVKAIAKFYNTASPANGCAGGAYPVSLVTVCPQIDLAVLVFPRGTAASLGLDSFPSVAYRSPRAGESITMFGFGPTAVHGSGGTKNAAVGIVSNDNGGVIILDVGNYANLVPGGNAGILNGDSGGPVFDASGAIVGVNSGFQYWGDGSFRSFVVDVRGSNSSAVFDYAYSYSDAAKRPGPIAGL